MKNVEIAKIVHEMNRRLCQLTGDDSQTPWESVPEWQEDATYNQILFAQHNPSAPANIHHKVWCDKKVADGWKWGPVKDVDKKEHPDLVDYYELSPVARLKDELFSIIVRYLSDY